jgi:hypothetical protein
VIGWAAASATIVCSNAGSPDVRVLSVTAFGCEPGVTHTVTSVVPRRVRARAAATASAPDGLVSRTRSSSICQQPSHGAQRESACCARAGVATATSSSANVM